MRPIGETSLARNPIFRRRCRRRASSGSGLRGHRRAGSGVSGAMAAWVSGSFWPPSASTTRVIPKRLNSRMQCWVDVVWSAGGSFGIRAEIPGSAPKLVTLTTRPVRLPSRSSHPPNGSAVSRVMPSTSRLARLAKARSSIGLTQAGRPPVAVLISSSVGSRRSANCTPGHPPTTCTQCGAGVRWAGSRGLHGAIVNHGTPSHRSSCA